MNNFLLGTVLTLLTLQLLLLGKESSSLQLVPRYWLTAILFAVCFIQKIFSSKKSFSGFSLPHIFLAVFMVWLSIRWGYAFFMPPAAETVFNVGVQKAYLQAPLIWLGYAMCFSLFYWIGFKKSNMTAIIRWLAAVTFVLALIALPPLLDHGDPVYRVPGRPSGFFGPWVYEIPVLKNFIFCRFAHVNVVGDILSGGIFFGLAIAIYGFYLQKIAKHKDTVYSHEAVFLKGLPSILLSLTMASIILAVVLLIYSRGSIISVILSIFVFLLAIVIKIRDVRILLISGALLTGLMAVGFWGGDWRSAMKEALTVTQETGEVNRSSYVNKRGAEIAKVMYKSNPFWGVGTQNFSNVSMQYDAQWKTGQPLSVYHYNPFCHYLNTLSEEGVGVYLYFVFLLSWAGCVIWGLFMTQSQYKFLVGLAFFCAALTLLIHAAFGVLMQYYATSALLYGYMGLSLACLQKSFRHDQ